MKQRLDPIGKHLCEAAVKINSAFRSRISNNKFSFLKHNCGSERFFGNFQNNVGVVFTENREEVDSVKVKCELFYVYVKQQSDSETINIKSFNTRDISEL